MAVIFSKRHLHSCFFPPDIKYQTSKVYYGKIYCKFVSHIRAINQDLRFWKSIKSQLDSTIKTFFKAPFENLMFYYNGDQMQIYCRLDLYILH